MSHFFLHRILYLTSFIFLFLGFSACDLLRSVSDQSLQHTSPLAEAANTSPVLPSSNNLTTNDGPEISEKQFSLTEPLIAGAMRVEGTGPRGTGIFIVDVSMMAEPLGKGFIQEDGTFAIDIQPPLEEGHFIGIMIGVLEGQETGPDFFQQFAQYAGDGVRDIPNLGTMWDTAEVASAN